MEHHHPLIGMQDLVAAASIGLGAGVSPGPLLTLVVTATLERGFGAGVRVAMAPLITDLPVIILAVFAAQAVPIAALSLLSLVGGLFVGYLGFDTLRQSRTAVLPAAGTLDAQAGDRRDLWRGAVVNILSPHPWLAWLTVLGPMLTNLGRRSLSLAGAFLVIFYLGLVGAKVVIAMGIARGRRHVDTRWYRVILAACGALLVALGAVLVFQGGRAWIG